MPRLVPPPAPREGAIQLGELPEFIALKQRLEAAPPETEIIQPEPNRPRSHAEQVRGPAKRDASDPRNVYRGQSIRIDLVDGDTYHLETTKSLPRYKQHMAVAAGFDPVGDADTALAWQADKVTHHETGKDLNLLAVGLDDKAQRLGR